MTNPFTGKFLLEASEFLQPDEGKTYGQATLCDPEIGAMTIIFVPANTRPENMVRYDSQTPPWQVSDQLAQYCEKQKERGLAGSWKQQAEVGA